MSKLQDSCNLKVTHPQSGGCPGGAEIRRGGSRVQGGPTQVHGLSYVRQRRSNKPDRGVSPLGFDVAAMR